MSGEQFALPDAVERHREIGATGRDVVPPPPIRELWHHRRRRIRAWRNAHQGRDGVAVSVTEGDYVPPVEATPEIATALIMPRHRQAGLDGENAIVLRPRRRRRISREAGRKSAGVLRRLRSDDNKLIRAVQVCAYAMLKSSLLPSCDQPG
jgi:hypothetical protein